MLPGEPLWEKRGGILRDYANPTYEKVLEGAKLARERGVDLILGAGGGSVMDC